MDRKRMDQILLFGLAVSIFTIILDDIGTGLLWWGYPVKLQPLYLILAPADITLVPIYLMIIYQFFNDSSQRFVTAIVVGGALAAFIFEYFFIWLDYYHRYTWKALYSWGFYILASLLGRFIVTIVRKRSQEV
ncbi:hypothetical protein PP175_19860 [Aneurinibacillus sp. Ricciae_BoGa-3]|uniref:CBO0543 family protein n=1 Tax=Aneurinibacillus sp. Ricciae_BoGa-3 TaxID=3022697 RepID=UPI002340A8A2|nr:CBO0543 family protein [Aneurinibacillus sp. Ricciae_BoGa-3]WCK53569.1 hypothetical protein PP175_19860 [Aneurinibacillus sp. Ricciae_BoGa-3]